jgi:hypothetical protein
MKKLIAISFAIFATVFTVTAQEDSYETTTRRAVLSTDTMTVDLMVIPANSKMYSSYFDRQMTEANKMEFKAMRDTILASLAYEVALAFNDSLPSGVILESKTGYPEDMNFVFESIEYKYDLLPEPKKKESTVNKWKNKVYKKEPKPEPRKGTYMEGGQIVSNPETKPRYTNIVVLNSDFLYLLNKRNHATTFVFINHYEMVIPTDVSQIAIQSDNYPRVIRVHYTIVDVEGNHLNSGIVSVNSSSYDDKLDYLIENSFLQLGKSIKHNLSESK